MRNFIIASSMLLALPATAATPINEVRPFDADGQIEIENLKGRIQVRGWDREEVKITGSLGSGVERLVIEGDRQNLEVRVKYPNNSGWGGNKSEPTDLQLMVPLRADLEIDSVSAGVDVSGVAAGDVSIDSVSGDIVVVGAPREIDVDSVSGGIRLTVNSSDVSAESVSGEVLLRGRMNGEISADSVSGGIEVVVNGEQIRVLKANTVSGNVSIDTALAPNGEIQLESISGRLALTVPANISTQARAESMSGTLVAPNVTVQKPRYGSGSSYSTRYGSGAGEINMQTLSGDAQLKFK